MLFALHTVQWQKFYDAQCFLKFVILKNPYTSLVCSNYKNNLCVLDYTIAQKTISSLKSKTAFFSSFAIGIRYIYLYHYL